MLSDIVIAQAAKMLPIAKVAEKLGLTDEDLIPYGRYKAKINHKLIHSDRPDGKLILVTAISPTPAGEGKTTTSVGLADALNAMGKKTMLCLREPSLGPVFGVKGGAAGGGYAQVVPMEDINLHFTGDIHAIGTANNLLAAMIDNSIQQGNPLNIDPRRIAWKRCMDMNDRQLRFIVDGLGGKVNGTPREDGFDITVASEIMAVLCLSDSLSDLKTFFMHPEFHALLETVGENGEFIDTINGRIINPGHCIETAWFILEESRYRGWDKEMLETALTILDWSWEWGWDKDFGGIINFRDCRNLPVQDYSQDMKFWWPQTEAIIATLYAYEATGDEKYLKMHNQVSDWTYAHFPDREYGEWYGYLHRDGSVAQPAKGNIFKGPFHIPRMMIKGHVLCNEILSGLSGTENIKL